MWIEVAFVDILSRDWLSSKREDSIYETRGMGSIIKSSWNHVLAVVEGEVASGGAVRRQLWGNIRCLFLVCHRRPRRVLTLVRYCYTGSH